MAIQWFSDQLVPSVETPVPAAWHDMTCKYCKRTRRTYRDLVGGERQVRCGVCHKPIGSWSTPMTMTQVNIAKAQSSVAGIVFQETPDAGKPLRCKTSTRTI